MFYLIQIILSKYAAWRASEEGKEWDDILKEAPTRKADLDLGFA